MTRQPDGTYLCALCGKATNSAFYARMHDNTFHPQQPDAHEKLFAALVVRAQAKREAAHDHQAV